jgi:hypothetical protein
LRQASTTLAEEMPSSRASRRIEVPDLAATVGELGSRGARFRNDIVTRTAGKQNVIEDPSSNPVELFQPILAEVRLSQPTT